MKNPENTTRNLSIDLYAILRVVTFIVAMLALAALSSTWASGAKPATLHVQVSKIQTAIHKPGPVYVILWFDTEDYVLPQSDDSAKRIAQFLTSQGVHATFKVVGEKARTLERRHREDVIAALNKHAIVYHSNYHSWRASPAEFEEPLDWQDGVEEFILLPNGLLRLFP